MTLKKALALSNAKPYKSVTFNCTGDRVRRHLFNYLRFNKFILNCIVSKPCYPFTSEPKYIPCRWYRMSNCGQHHQTEILSLLLYLSVCGLLQLRVRNYARWTSTDQLKNFQVHMKLSVNVEWCCFHCLKRLFTGRCLHMIFVGGCL